jgi:hypothetical protein
MCPECGFGKTAVRIRPPRRSGSSGSLYDLLDAMLGSRLGVGAFVMLGLTILWAVLRSLTT